MNQLLFQKENTSAFEIKSEEQAEHAIHMQPVHEEHMQEQPVHEARQEEIEAPVVLFRAENGILNAIMDCATRLDQAKRWNDRNSFAMEKKSSLLCGTISLLIR